MFVSFFQNIYKKKEDFITIFLLSLSCLEIRFCFVDFFMFFFIHIENTSEEFQDDLELNFYGHASFLKSGLDRILLTYLLT